MTSINQVMELGNAPQFSTDDRLVLEKDTQIAQTSADPYSEDQDFEWHFEIVETVKWVKENSFKRVALQFPDSLLYMSVKVSFTLEEMLGFKPYILADTSYGSCCVDDVAAQHVEADCIVHFGDACMSKVHGRTPVRYVLSKNKIDFDDFTSNLLRWKNEQTKDKTVLFLFDVDFIYCRNKLEAVIVEIFGERAIVCFDVDLTTSQKIDCNFMLFTGPSNKFRATLLAMINPLVPLFVYDPSAKNLKLMNFDANRTMRKRLFLIEKAKDAAIIGIVVGTVNVAQYLQVLDKLKLLCKKSNKKYYVLFVGKLNVAKLSNFADVDIFVLLSCPFGVVFDWSDYYRPIITPFEFEAACQSNGHWMCGSGWNPAPSSILQTDSTDGNQENPNSETDFSLTSGDLRNLRLSDNTQLSQNGTLLPRSDAYQVQIIDAEHRFLQRSWKGLEERLGETPVGKIETGRSGIASGYETEIKNPGPDNEN